MLNVEDELELILIRLILMCFSVPFAHHFPTRRLCFFRWIGLLMNWLKFDTFQIRIIDFRRRAICMNVQKGDFILIGAASEIEAKGTPKAWRILGTILNAFRWQKFAEAKTKLKHNSLNLKPLKVSQHPTNKHERCGKWIWTASKIFKWKSNDAI